MGFWKKDKVCGKGILYHSDWDTYEGEWFNDKPNGIDIYIHADGTKYGEEWKDDKQSGEGRKFCQMGRNMKDNIKKGKIWTW